MNIFEKNKLYVFSGDALELYKIWKSPVSIISDGPYGVNGYPGDLFSPEKLGEWYEPHVEKWTEMSTPQTTLWFWNTELGWANVHPILVKHGWEFKSCNIWDKGMGHVAGNVNTKTISRLPVVTEVCVQYVKKASFLVDGSTLDMQNWLRYEWKRTGLAFSKTNIACGVKNAASRKYFTNCHLWYMPPADAFEQIVNYANLYGKENGLPYFSIDGSVPLTKSQWEGFKPKFNCPMGLTNVWNLSQLRGNERIKNGNKAVHFNQKPLELISNIIKMSSDEGDVIWDPFGGLFTSAVACYNTNRQCFTSEIRKEMYELATDRLLSHIDQPQQLLIQ